jgi:predicted RNA-binding Zn-ribbon protein involved in translation (DUF1610 family)
MEIAQDVLDHCEEIGRKGAERLKEYVAEPCPFCGETVIHRVDLIEWGSSFHMCSRCGAKGPQAKGYAAAAEAWDNTTLRAELAVAKLLADEREACCKTICQFCAQGVALVWESGQPVHVPFGAKGMRYQCHAEGIQRRALPATPAESKECGE